MISRKVLIVDDNADNLALLARVLKKMDHETIAAHNGIDALELLQEKMDIDFIITDLDMPEMDGEEFIRHKNGMPEKSGIPTILWSASVAADEIAARHNALFLSKFDIFGSKLHDMMLTA